MGGAIVGGLSRFDSLASERVREQSLIQIQFEYTQCLARVDNRTAIRNVFTGIFNLFPEAESITRMRAYLDENYPPGDDAECLLVLTQAGLIPDPSVFPEGTNNGEGDT